MVRSQSEPQQSVLSRISRHRIKMLKNTHCKEDPIYVFPEIKLRGLSHNLHIHVYVSDLYVPLIGPPVFMQQNRHTDRGNIKIAHRNVNVGIENEAAQFHFW
jgi:hypothetical protein